MLDRYILAKAKAAVLQVQASMDAYDTPGATDAITGFLDVLNNWYIRRSRPRFWGEEMTADKQSAYDTLFTVLELMCRAAAPLLPFVSEVIYRGLNGNAASVHLTDFPDVSGIDDAVALTADMDWVRDVCNAGSAVRNKQNIRNRQPLSELTFICNSKYAERFVNLEQTAAFTSIIRDEVNVKKFVIAGGALEDYATVKLQINSAVLGKRLPAAMKQILPASKKGEWKRVDGAVEIAGEKLLPSEYTILLEPKADYKDSAAPLSTNDALVILDLTITPELEAEGRARDLVRMIQQARKDAGLNVADRITLAVDVPAAFKPVLVAHGDYIKEQTLAVSIGEGSEHAAQQMKQELDGEQFVIGLSKVA
jgi:isoleucyl-tRNA synthetase